MIEVIKLINTGLSLLVELVAIASVGYIGYHLACTAWVKWVLAVTLPAVLMVIWGYYAAPGADARLAGYGLLALKVGLFGGVAIGLYLIGARSWAVTFAVAVAVNLAIEFTIG